MPRCFCRNLLDSISCRASCPKELLPLKHLRFCQYLLQKNDIILQAGLNSRPKPSILSGDAAPGRQASELRRAPRAFQTTRAGPEEKRERLEGGRGGWELVAFRSSNHSRERKSRPLRRQPVRERWEGVRTAQAVLFIKHTPLN